jgi:hypothetical protein
MSWRIKLLVVFIFKLWCLLQGDVDTGGQRILSDTERTEGPPLLNNLVLEHMLQLPGLDKEMILKVKLMMCG